METREVLFSRKSVRSYCGKISEEQLKEILMAAQASPVGMGKYETMHLTVIEEPQFLHAIDASTAKMFGRPDMHPLYGAPTFVVVSVKPEGEKPDNSELSNAAIMAHNMAIAAVDAGVGCCDIWGAVMAVNLDQGLIERLELPEGFVPCCGIVLGETKEKYVSRDIPENRVGVNYVK